MKNTLERHRFKCEEHTNARLSMSTCLGDSSDPQTDSNRPQGWGLVTAGSMEARSSTAQGLIPHREDPRLPSGKEGFQEANSVRIRDY